jgi:hypothetical protein
MGTVVDDVGWDRGAARGASDVVSLTAAWTTAARPSTVAALMVTRRVTWLVARL